MEKLREYSIEFMKLGEGTHQFTYEIDRRFFELFPQDRITGGTLHGEVTLHREETLLKFDFEIEGTVETTCDRCLNALTYPVACFEQLVVTLGSSFEEQDVDVIEIPATEHKFNIAQYLYEYILTSLPMYMRCDDVEGLQCDEQTLKFIASEPEKKEEDPADPRWNALKNIDIKE